MYVSTELIGLLGSTIALGGLLFAVGRAIRGDLKAEVGAIRGDLKAEVGALRGDLKAEVGAIRGDLKAEVGALRKGMGAGDAALSEEIGALRAEMKADHQALRAEMKAGFGELNTRVGGVEQRLSRGGCNRGSVLEQPERAPRQTGRGRRLKAVASPAAACVRAASTTGGAGDSGYRSDRELKNWAVGP